MPPTAPPAAEGPVPHAALRGQNCWLGVGVRGHMGVRGSGSLLLVVFSPVDTLLPLETSTDVALTGSPSRQSSQQMFSQSEAGTAFASQQNQIKLSQPPPDTALLCDLGQARPFSLASSWNKGIPQMSPGLAPFLFITASLERLTDSLLGGRSCGISVLHS